MNLKQSDQTLYTKSLDAALPVVRFPADVYVSCKFQENIDQCTLLPEEQKYLQNFSHKRIVDFTLGRACAREILKNLGYERYAVLIGENRQPLWPENLVGSISHADQLALCVIAEKCELRSLGIDIELIKNESFDLYSMVASDKELQQHCDDQNDSQYKCPYLAKLLFSAKEAVYKCQFPLYQQWIEFKDISLELDFARNTFITVISNQNNLITIHGAWDANDKYIISTAWLE